MVVYKPIVVDGIRYASVAEACRKHGFPDRGDASYIGRLLNGGMTFHDAAKLRRAYNADMVVPVLPHVQSAPSQPIQPKNDVVKNPPARQIPIAVNSLRVGDRAYELSDSLADVLESIVLSAC